MVDIICRYLVQVQVREYGWDVVEGTSGGEARVVERRSL